METLRTPHSPSHTRRPSMIAMSSVSLLSRISVEWVLAWLAGTATWSSAQPLLPSSPVPLIRSEWELFLRPRSTLLDHMLVVPLVSSLCTFPMVCLDTSYVPIVQFSIALTTHVL